MSVSGGVLGVPDGRHAARSQCQTIGFLSHLRHKGINGPFLILAPLSTLSNWINEVERFCPSMPAVLYHGTAAERTEIRRKRMPTGEPTRNPPSPDEAHTHQGLSFPHKNRKYPISAWTRLHYHSRGRCHWLDWLLCCFRGWGMGRAKHGGCGGHAPTHAGKKVTASFPTVVTSFEILMRDSKALARYNWKYIVVDEGHR